MHLINNSLARALTLPLVLLVIMITSCTPDPIKPNPVDVCPNLPGVQTSTADCPRVTVPGAPYLNASLTRDTAWYKGADTCNFSSNGVVKYNGSSEVTNPIILTDITAPVSIQLTSTITANGLVSPTTTKNLTVQVYSENKTLVCKDVIWRRDTTYKSNTLFSANEVPTSYTPIQTAQDNYVYQFFTNNTYLLTIPGFGTYTRQYHFENLDTKIIIDSTTLEVRSSSLTRLVLAGRSQVIDMNTGQPLNQWVESLIVFKKV